VKKFIGDKSGGEGYKLLPDHKRVFIELLGKGGIMADGRYVMTIEKEYPQHSNEQRKYAHGVVFPMIAAHMSEGSGKIHTDSDIKDKMKKIFLTIDKWETSLIIADEQVQIGNIEPAEKLELAKMVHTKEDKDFHWRVRSSSSLNSKEYSRWMENIRRWADVSLFLYIPLPNETPLNIY